MRMYIDLIKSIQKKRKIFSITIFILSLLTIISATSVINALINNSIGYSEKYKNANLPDVLLSFNGSRYKDNYISELEEFKDVKNAKVVENISTTVKDKNDNNLSLLVKSEEQTKLEEKLHSDEIYLSNHFESNFDYSVGDKIEVEIGGINLGYTVGGFFEDILFGSPIMKYNQAVISKDSFDKLIDNKLVSQENKTNLIYLNWNKSIQGNSEILTSKNMKRFSGAFSTDFIYEKEYIKKAYTMIPTIVSILLLLASAFIAVGSFLVLRYSILTTIEMDRVEIGTLKALGMKNVQIKLVYLLSNLIYVITGGILGIVLSNYVTHALNKMYQSINGLDTNIRNSSDMKLSFIVLLFFIFFAIVIVLLSFKKLKKITPIQAISNQKNNQKNKMMFDLNKRVWIPFQFRLSIKQYFYKYKSYLSLVLITALFSFLLFSLFALSNSFRNKGDVYNLLGLPKNDLIMVSENEADINSLIKDIDKKYEIEYSEQFKQSTVEAEGENMIALIYGSFSERLAINEGDIPKKANEVLLTNYLSKKLRKSIGDYIEIKSSKGIIKDFKIVGLYQTVNNLGVEVQMLEAGFDLINSDMMTTQKVLQFKSPTNLNEIVSNYEKNEFGVSIINGRINSDNLINNIKSSVSLISYAVLLITTILIALISFLLTLISIKREYKELFIFKMIGLKFKEIRRQYTLRILFSSSIGLILGSSIYILFSNVMFRSIMELVGLTNINVTIQSAYYLFVLCFIATISVIICMFSTRSLKNL